MKRIVLFLIKAYKMLMSPIVGRHCRFVPTCSDYTYQAIEKFGILRGVYMGMRRILKCHPFHEGGFDPVP
jgi:putative membrane protein insertion efficiency factor